MQQLILSALSALITAAVGALGGYLLGRIKHEGKKNKAMEDGVKGLLRAKILDLGLHYLAEGTMPPYGMETLRGCYDPYIALGDGDPSVAHIMKKCESLPVRSGGDD